ncbi:MAG: hypothetical protein GY754_11560 [bacterium]|nr:hypothetical protein [bacterium]
MNSTSTAKNWRQRHPFAVQYMKYLLAGSVATLIYTIIFFLCSWKLFPALNSEGFLVKLFGIQVSPITDSVRGTNFMINNIIGFVASNIAAYTLNAIWVFEQGRYNWFIEMVLFFAVAAVGAFAATPAMGYFIKNFGIPTPAAFIGSIGIAALLNFIMRKYVIFKG